MLELNSIYLRSNTSYSSHSKSENGLAVSVGDFGYIFNGLAKSQRVLRSS